MDLGGGGGPAGRASRERGAAGEGGCRGNTAWVFAFCRKTQQRRTRVVWGERGAASCLASYDIWLIRECVMGGGGVMNGGEEGNCSLPCLF